MNSLAAQSGLRVLAGRERATPWPAGAPHVVGGAVRDALLGRQPSEIDIVVPGDAGAWAAGAARALGTQAVQIDERIGVWRLPLADGGQLDVARMTGPGAGELAHDLARRDFSIDALAVALGDLANGDLADIPRTRVIDQHAGLADLDSGRLRATNSAVFREDPLRGLRGARLTAQLQFDVDPETQGWIAAAARLLDQVAPERVGAELRRLFAQPHAARGVALMESTGLLSVCFPELDAGRGVDQRPLHAFDVFTHALTASMLIDVLLLESAPADRVGAALWEELWRPDWPSDLRGHFRRHGAILRLAALLHDVAKPETRSLETDGRTRFFGHAERGAEVAAERLRRWRFPNAEIDRLALLVSEHLRPGQVASPGQPPTPRALHRFQRRLGDAAADLCWLYLADSLATVGPEALLPRWPAYVAHVERIVSWRPPASARRIARLVDGRAVMAATGLPSGPAIGRILRAIDEAAAAGDVRSEADAIALATTLAQTTENAAKDSARG